jgi:multiple antibiotic resistance protein
MAPDAVAHYEKLLTLLFMMMGPTAVMPVFAALTETAEPKLSRQIALRAACFAGGAVTLAVLLGYNVLTSWGASPASLIIAGGLLLLLSALQTTMMRPMSTGTRAPLGEPSLAIALSPLAFPGIVAPHAIGVLIIFAAYLRGSSDHLVILAAGLTVVILDLGGMLVAKPVLRWIGHVPLRILGAVFGVLQVALGVQFIVDGIARTPLFR